MREAKLALNIDPLSVRFNYHIGVIHYFSRRYEQGIEQFHETNELDPHFSPAHQFLALAYARKGLRQDAMAEVRKLADNDLRTKALSGMVSVLTGRPVEAREILDELRLKSGPPNFSFAYYS